MEEFNDAFAFNGYIIKGQKVPSNLMKWMNLKLEESIKEEDYEESEKLKNEIQKLINSQMDIKI